MFTASYLRIGARVFRREPRFLDLIEPHAHRLAVHFELNSNVIDRLQQSRIALAALARHFELHKHARARKPVEVGPGTQHPVLTRRGHFQRVRGRNRVLDVEQRGHLAAHALAIVDTDSALPERLAPILDFVRFVQRDRRVVLFSVASPGAIGTQAVNIDAQERVAAVRHVFELDQLVPQPFQEGLNEGDQPPTQDRRHRNPPSAQTKMGPEAQFEKPAFATGKRALRSPSQPTPARGRIRHSQKKKGPRGPLSNLTASPTSRSPCRRTGRARRGRAF